MTEKKKKKVLIDTIGRVKKVVRPKITQDSTRYKIKIEKPDLDKKISKRNKIVKKLSIIFAVFVIVISLGWVGIVRSPLYKIYKVIRGSANSSYIVGFQNSAELRPTGGFWGSFAYVEIPDDLKKTEIIFETNPYKNSNLIEKEADVNLPKPMQTVWQGKSQCFVNANWQADFIESAKTIEWYFGRGWNKQSDGIIAVSSLSLIDLLKLTGPIEMEDRTLITSDNFSQIMSQKIDTEYWDKEENHDINEPKTIIKDLFPIIIERAKKVPPIKMIGFVKKQIESNRVLVYLNDQKLQTIIEEMGVSGKILPYEVDYLHINNANLAGDKTSLNVSQNFKYSVTSDGQQYTANLEITRSHKADTWPTHPNRNYTRVFTPLGAKLTSLKTADQDLTSQVDQTEEYGRSVFGFWFTTNPGESLTATLVYSLPFKLNSTRDYKLTLQRQPGTLPDDIELNLFGKIIEKRQFDRAALKL